MKTIKHLFFTALMLLCITAVKAQSFEVDGLYYRITSETDKTVELTSGNDKYSGDIEIPETVTYIVEENSPLIDWTSTNKLDYSTSENRYTLNVQAGNVLKFDWSVSSESSFDKLTIYLIENETINITLVDAVSGENSGSESYTFTNTGTYTLVAEYTKDQSQSNGADEGRIYNIELLQTDNFADWTSDNKGDETTSEIEYTLQVEAGDVLKFDWSVSSESGYDWLTITLAGEQIFYESGVNSGSYEKTFETAGTYYLYVKYTKDISQSKNNDEGKIYNIELIKNSNSESGDNTDLTEVTYTVTNIAANAFKDCENLTSIEIPNSITFIGDNAFNHCLSLTSVVIPNSITNIGENAFDNCSALTAVYINNLSAWCKIFFGNDTSNPLTYAKNLYYNGNLVTALVIPNDITTISNDAFNSCQSITSIEIPNNITTIASDAFANCNNLSNVYCYATDLPETNTDVFDNSNIENVTLHVPAEAIVNYRQTSPWSNFGTITTLEGDEGDGGDEGGEENETVTNFEVDGIYYNVIGENNVEVISGEYEYTGDIEIPENVTYNECIYNVTRVAEQAFANCSGLTSVNIPNSVTNIGAAAFGLCDNLTNVTLPNSITSIAEEMFYGCSALNNIVIPNSVIYIEEKAFMGCSELTDITIGSTMEEIDDEVFADCEKLTNIYCNATVVPYASYNIFNDSYPEYITLYVPAELVENYKEISPWNSIGTIKPLGEVDVPQCATPVISYNKSGLDITCDTEDAEFVTEVTCSDINSYNDSRIDFTVTYNITTYATKAGYSNSETVTAVLYWVDMRVNSDVEDVYTIESLPVFITCKNGIIRVEGGKDDAYVYVYTIDGSPIVRKKIANGKAELDTKLNKGEIVIVKCGGKSVKFIIQ